MKRLLFTVHCLLFTVHCSLASPNAVTNYIPGIVVTTQGWDSVESSGLDTNLQYLCIPVASLPSATAAQLGGDGTGDVRRLIYAINDITYTNYVASTNRPANWILEKTTLLQSQQYRIRHQADTWFSFTPILTLE
jgi:hypothetical protein